MANINEKEIKSVRNIKLRHNRESAPRITMSNIVRLVSKERHILVWMVCHMSFSLLVSV